MQSKPDADPLVADILLKVDRAIAAAGALEDPFEAERTLVHLAETLRAFAVVAAGERRETARRIRENNGLTYIELGHLLGMSKVRAHQVVNGNPKKQARPTGATVPAPVTPPVPSLPEMEIGEADLATALYRMYDASGILLYAGIADNLKVRFDQHKRESTWWPDVTRRTVTWYGSRSDALAAEDIAIKTEHPVHNIMGVIEKMRVTVA